MKIKLYPKDLLEAAWRQDKKLYADGDAAEPPQCLRCGAPLAAHLMVNALSRYPKTNSPSSVFQTKTG